MTEFHLHLVSDATGETLNAIAHAAIVQFEEAKPVEHIWALVRTPRQIEKVLTEIEAHPGIVMFTMVDNDIRTLLQMGCRNLQIPCIPVLDGVMSALASFLGETAVNLPGIQHVMNAEYFDRIEAMNFTLAHDDGQATANLREADIVLVGVSRTSKTPTSIYLANRGLKVANVPLVPDCPLPEALSEETIGLIVGLTTSPERLVQIRRNRLLALRQDEETEYIDADAVRDEVKAARRLFSAREWPVIDVTRRSIEETAAAILNLHHDHAET
jgi:regulator of PEP synthase PpsR (kinase-PPPase family)